MLFDIGAALLQAGRPQESVTVFRRCLAVCQEAGNREREATALMMLGAVLVDAEQYAEAARVNQRAVEFCRALGDARGLQLAADHLGKALRGLR